MGMIFKGQHEKSPTEALRSGGVEGIGLYLVPILADILSLLVRQAADLIDLFHFRPCALNSLIMRFMERSLEASSVPPAALMISSKDNSDR